MNDVSRNMRRTGMLLFRNAFMEALQGDKLMCVVHAAHAAEILLKARIAQEHPLLIFSKLPKASSNQGTLTMVDLLEKGRTLSYEELPDQLWATTGIKLDKAEQYNKFGRLRNQLIHLAMPTNSERMDELTIHYSLEVLDPLIEQFWGRSVIDFITKDPDYYASFVQTGLLEDLLRKILRIDQIDQRLRRLLGDNSEKAWKKLNEHLNGQYEFATDEEWQNWNNSKTNKEWEADYEHWLALQPENQQTRQMEDKDNWNAFLQSF